MYSVSRRTTTFVYDLDRRLSDILYAGAGNPTAHFEQDDEGNRTVEQNADSRVSRGKGGRERVMPLGTEARVTNLKTGKSATVTIQDRGPYVKGRIVDLSPATADQIGITPKEGVAKVEVAPIVVPPHMEDGRDRPR